MQREVSYSEAVAAKYPEQVVVAIAKDTKGKYNPITLGWTMIASGTPPMMAVAIGKEQWSTQAFRHAGEFVIAFPSEHQQKDVMLFGTRSGRDCDKLAEAHANTGPARAIDGVLLADAVANFECKLVGEMEAGDHIIFLGEVVGAHRNEADLNRLYTVAPGYKMRGLARGRSSP
jgi:flavin reductase (DIM6/NTAB) family NADH-FMN oxidoreductase RutF